MNKVKCNNITFGSDELPFIGGPCVIESRDHVLKMAEEILSVTDKLDIPFVFKTSFDKANRTSIKSFRGHGLDEGLKILQEVKNSLKISITTDVHHPEQANLVGEVVDILQIPAFLCRQTDLLLAAANTGKVVNIKKGQFLSPYKVKNIINKILTTGNNNILITERGNSFGYDNLVSDMRSIQIMQEFDFPVIYDATHSAQIPGNLENTTSGHREFIPGQVRAAVATGCDGIFMEVHDDVNNALSDASTQWPLEKLEPLLISMLEFRKAYLSNG